MEHLVIYHFTLVNVKIENIEFSSVFELKAIKLFIRLSYDLEKGSDGLNLM